MKTRIYKSKDGWRWRAVAANGKILADSGEGYKNRKDCVAAWKLVTNSLLLQTIKDDLQAVVNSISAEQGWKAR